MIFGSHIKYLDKLWRESRGFGKTMLMLGRQEVVGLAAESSRELFVERYGLREYEELDPDGGDIEADLCLWEHDKQYDTVFNFGTIEHIWDVHSAWTHAADAVRVGGLFVTHTPSVWWGGHGVHVTSAWAVEKFFSVNGFEFLLLEEEDGVTCDGRSRGKVLWGSFRRVADVKDWERPQQTFKNGRVVRRG